MSMYFRILSVLFLFFFFSGCSVPDWTPQQKDELSEYHLKGKSPKELMDMAKETTDVALLRELSENDNEGVRSDVAKNSALPIDIQKTLVDDKNWMVRNYLGANRSIDSSVAQILSDDSDHRVRWTVAKNPNSPEEILLKLAEDESPQVLLKLISNEAITVEVMMKVAEVAPATIAVELLKREDIPESVMIVLKGRTEEKIQKAIESQESLSSEGAGDIQSNTQ